VLNPLIGFSSTATGATVGGKSEEVMDELRAVVVESVSDAGMGCRGGGAAAEKEVDITNFCKSRQMGILFPGFS